MAQHRVLAQDKYGLDEPFWPRCSKSWRCVHVPFLLDHVQNKARSTALGVVSFAMLFAVALFLIFSAFFRDPRPFYGRAIVDSMETVLVPPAEGFVSALGEAGNVFAAKFYLRNAQNFGVAGAAMFARIVWFKVPSAAGSRIVSCLGKRSALGTLQLDQFGYLCEVLVHAQAWADEFGVVVFDALSFLPTALPGEYRVEFRAGDNSSALASSTLAFETSIVLRPVAARLFVVNTTLPCTYLGDGTASCLTSRGAYYVLNVRVRDSNNNRLVGRAVQLISRDLNGNMLQSPFDFNYADPRPVSMLDARRGKHTALGGTLLAYTDASGLAALNFTVLGSSSVTQYVLISCEGVESAIVTSGFAAPSAGRFLLSDAYAGILLDKDFLSVQLLEQGSSSVVEGEALASQPVIQVSYRLSPSVGYVPAVGVLAYAFIVADPLAPVPDYFAVEDAKQVGFRKDLVGAISLASDADGVARFTNLGFSAYGPAGQYLIRVSIEGFVSPAVVPILVNSSVAQVTLDWTPPSLIQLPANLQGLPTVLVLDAEGNPIEGKQGFVDTRTDWMVSALIQPTDFTGIGSFVLLDFHAMLLPPAPLGALRAATVGFSVSVDGVRSNIINITLGMISEPSAQMQPVVLWAESNAGPLVLDRPSPAGLMPELTVAAASLEIVYVRFVLRAQLAQRRYCILCTR